MLRHDRVYCDCCGQLTGQIWGMHYTSTPAIPDKTKPPHFVLCDACLAAMNTRTVTRSSLSIGSTK